MAIKDTPAQSAQVPPPAAKRPRWLRMLAIIILIPVAAFILLIIIGMFAPKPKATDATSVLRALAGSPVRATEAGIEGNLTETSPLPGPMGLLSEFLWTSRPNGMDGELYAFDTRMSATGAFEHLNETGSLLVPADDGDTHFSSYEHRPRDGGPADLRLSCARSTKGFACGSVSTTLPVIIILRKPSEPAPPPAAANDPLAEMARWKRLMDGSNAMADDIASVDATLQRLGITAQPAAN